MKKKDLSIIIPCYNEERNIRLGVLENIAAYLKKVKFSYEVIIVDDGSTDETLSLLTDFVSEHPKFRIIKTHHGGKALAVISGMKEGKGDYILFCDMDQATPLREWSKLYPFFGQKYDVVIASRSGIRHGAPQFRKTMAKGFMILRNIILDLGIVDTQCGFKAFTADAAEKILKRLIYYREDRRVHGSTVTAGFDVELLFIAKELGYKIKEVPVDWHYQETRHVSPIKDSLEGFLALLRIKLNSMQGYYKTGNI